jgi:large subunit ribosomal protein L3
MIIRNRKALMGTKIGMTQIFNSSGSLIPVTVVKILRNVVLGIKTNEKDGYVSTLVGYGNKEEKKMTKPEMGLFKKLNVEPVQHLKEIRDMSGHELGKVLPLDLFKIGEMVDIEGVSKGHGFTGAIER